MNFLIKPCFGLSAQRFKRIQPGTFPQELTSHGFGLLAKVLIVPTSLDGFLLLKKWEMKALIQTFLLSSIFPDTTSPNGSFIQKLGAFGLAGQTPTSMALNLKPIQTIWSK